MKTHILIVDDDKNFVETLKDGLRLKELDADVTVAASAHEALSVLSRAVPSLVVLDVQLPDMHGVELLRTIKESARLKKVPVIFISAKYTEPADRAEAVLAGGVSFFSKPVDIDDLWQEIRYLLDKEEKG